MYRIETGLNAKLDEKLKTIQLAVDQHRNWLNVEITSRYSTLSKVLDDIMSQYDSEIADLKASMPVKDLDELVEIFKSLEEKVEEVDINKPSVTFIFESDVTPLLDAKNAGKRWRSEFFFCRGKLTVE